MGVLKVNTDDGFVTIGGIKNPTNEQVESAVKSWLDKHPEATTTVEDGSITTDKLASDVLSVSESELYTIELASHFVDDGTTVFTIADYFEIVLAGHVTLYDADNNVLFEGWGTWDSATDTYGAVYGTCADGGSVRIYEKKYASQKKLKIAGKYDKVETVSKETTDTLVYTAEGHTYTDEDVDFAKPVVVTWVSGNDIRIRVYTAFGATRGETFTFDVPNGEAVTLPAYTKKIIIEPYNGGAVFTYYKKVTSGLTMPDLELVQENFTADTLNYLSETLEIGKTVPDDIRTDRALVWAEEFDGNAVDTNIWQWEVSDWRRGYLKESNMFVNSFVRNGELVLRLLRDSGISEKPWSGSIMRSCGGFEFLYGRIEAKIKFPTTGGYMSFWLMGINGAEKLANDDTADGTYNSGYGWPKCGEIDIAESDSGKVSCTLHFLNADGEQDAISGAGNYCPTSTEDYHVYALERTAESVSVYCDDSLIKTFDITGCAGPDGLNPFQLPMHIVLSTLPGVPAVVGTPPAADVNLIDGYVKWVRCYAPEGVANIDPTDLVVEGNADGAFVEMAVGDEKIPSFAFSPENVTNQTLVWNSTNPDVATVCKFGGYIKAVSAGYTTVTATAWNGVQASIIVHVS